MARTATQLVQGVGRKLSNRVRYILNTGTGGPGTWTDATNLADRVANWYNGMWLYHVNDAKEWRISADSGAGVLTLDPATVPTSTSDYEILPARPSDILAAINDAIDQLSYRVGRTVIDNSYVTDSPIFNAGFEDTTGAAAIDGWVAVTTTMTRESTADKKLGGAYSVRLDTTNGYIHPTAEFQDMLLDLAGNNVTLYYPCKTSTANTARLSWVADGTVTNGSYHTGGGGWETLSVTVSVPARNVLDTLDFRLNRDAGGTVYYDNGWIEGGLKLYTYRMPASLPRGPSAIRIQGIDDRDLRIQHRYRRLWAGWDYKLAEDANSATTRGDLSVIKPSSFGRWFMVGTGPLTTLVARTDYAEVAADAAELIEARAAIILLKSASRPEALLRLRDLTILENQLLQRLPETLGVAQLSVR